MIVGKPKVGQKVRLSADGLRVLGPFVRASRENYMRFGGDFTIIEVLDRMPVNNVPGGEVWVVKLDPTFLNELFFTTGELEARS